MFKSKAGLLATAFILTLAPLLGSCGNEDIAPCQTSGPTERTSSGYQFDFTICPYAVTVDGTVSLSVRVWDNIGNSTAGVGVNFSGSSEEAMTVTTNARGYAEFIHITTGLAGTVGSITATVENKSVTLSYNILPETGYE